MSARDLQDLTITRTIRAPRQKVFDAFVQPELVRRWFGPRGFTITHAELDARVGGRYRITMLPRMGESNTVTGVYREVRAPERLAFTWKWEGGMNELPETLVTVSFSERQAEHGIETQVSLVHSGFPSAQARDGHMSGWNSTLNDLVDLLDPRGSAATLTLYGDPRSSYVRTVRMALAEKRRAYAYEPVPPHSEVVLKMNPFGRVPVFTDGDFTLYETAAIVRYIDDCFADPPLVPRSASDRARMEQWISLINSHCYDAMVRRYVLQYVFPKGDGGAPDRKCIDAALPDMRKLLQALDGAYGTRDTLAGDAITIADLLLAPIVFYLNLFPEGQAMVAEMRNVTRAHQAIAKRDSFLSTMPKLG